MLQIQRQAIIQAGASRAHTRKKRTDSDESVLFYVRYGLASRSGFAGLELSLGTRSVPVPGKDVPSDLEPSDVDHDGIADAHDRCPWVSAPEYIDGCPHDDLR